MPNKSILIAITGGIALYKIPDLIRSLRKEGHDVHVVMTKNAMQFIQPMTFEAISENPVMSDTYADPMSHIRLADSADIFLIAPASYNVIGKIANGIADDLVSTIASAVTCRKILAPAMNVHMYENPILQKNLSTLQETGYEIIVPDSGPLACGYEGMGRLRRVEDILSHILKDKNSVKPLLTGKKVLITAGGTMEKIDPVRFIGNLSSGKMGIALAEAARDMGGTVTLIHSQIKAQVPANVVPIYAESARDMQSLLETQIEDTDLLIMAAAVADYRVETVSQQKIKKDQPLTLTLVQNPDILSCLSQQKKSHQVFVGFAAESEDLITNAKTKLKKKNIDLIIANDISRQDIGFNNDENEVTVLFSSGETRELTRKTKYHLSLEILELIHSRFYQ